MGRGLAAILSTSAREESGLREIPTELIRPNPTQPRREFDDEALVALAESVKARGILQPVVVRRLAGGKYELVAGERRLRAAVIAGLGQVPAIVRETAESERLELALIENMARQDLNAIEEARACATLVEDLGLTKEEVGRRVGRSRVAVPNLIRLLELPDEALALIERGELSEGHGRALLTAEDHDRRRTLARAAAASRWSVRELESRAREADGSERRSGARKRTGMVLHPDQQAAAERIGDAMETLLGREVEVRPARGDGYRVEFAVGSLEDALELVRSLRVRAAA